VPAKSIWNNTGYYLLGDEIGDTLGISAAGEYGFDTVALSWDSTGTTLNHTIVANMVAKDYYLGQFGISPRSTNFTTTNDNSSALDDPQPSYLSLLKQHKLIPSLSWGFNPGSYSRSQTYTNTYGSLILGGYDTGRLSGTPLSIPMGADDGRELIVGIQAIITQPPGSTAPGSLLSTPLLAALDSTQPYIWLPLETCQLFEKAFGITWNETAEMYLLNSTLHSTLVSQNATITFTLGASTSGGNKMDIVLPYSAFDLTASYPLTLNSTPYFPLKRAANSTQYTLGRAFMQEAYIFADYERHNFSIAQAQWPPSSAHLVAISSTDTPTTNKTTSATKPTSNELSDEDIAGIVIAIVVVLLLTSTFFFVLYRRRRRRQETLPENLELDAEEAAKVEMDGLSPKKIQLDAVELAVKPPELDGIHVRPELDGTNPAVELEA
jgi:hypothetical protein